jgi:NAD+ synthase
LTTSATSAPRPGERDPASLAEGIVRGLGAALARLARRGAVVAVSGGVDSAVAAALCVEALGRGRVLLLRMPEVAGDPSSAQGAALAGHLGAESLEQPIGAALEALGHGALRDEALLSAVPGYRAGRRFKLVRSAVGGIVVFSVDVEEPDGSLRRTRLPADACSALVGAMNLKQRVRKTIEYTHADARCYAVVGTANLLEHDQGFFVRGGDGLADVKPLAGLYKSDVYRLAEHLGIPAPIRDAPPTTGTFSLPQTQAEFYFGHDWLHTDWLLWGERAEVPAREVAAAIGLDEGEVAAAYADLRRKRAATARLHGDGVVLDRVG